jgi:hypothetical protein
MDRRKMDLPDYVTVHGSAAELEKQRSGICVLHRLSAHPWGLMREVWAGPGLWWAQRPRWRLWGCVSLGGPQGGPKGGGTASTRDKRHGGGIEAPI